MVSTSLVVVTGTEIVMMLVNMIVFVSVISTVEVVDSFVMTVEVTGQVVVLPKIVVSE